MGSDEQGWWRGKKAALVVAHPGHELRVHHWMETAKPLVMVLTDGSGHLGVGRLDRTTDVLAGAGARPAAAFFGKMADRDLYRAILTGEAQTFQQLVDEMTTILADEAIDYVAADASKASIRGTTSVGCSSMRRWRDCAAKTGASCPISSFRSRRTRSGARRPRQGGSSFTSTPRHSTASLGPSTIIRN